MSEGKFFHYLPSKQAMLEAIVHKGGRKAAQRFTRLVHEPDVIVSSTLWRLEKRLSPIGSTPQIAPELSLGSVANCFLSLINGAIGRAALDPVFHSSAHAPAVMQMIRRFLLIHFSHLPHIGCLQPRSL